jgi:type II secretory pathway component PulJ
LQENLSRAGIIVARDRYRAAARRLRNTDVEKSIKHIHKKSCAPNWFYLQDYTRMDGQQDIKNQFIFSQQIADGSVGQVA